VDYIPRATPDDVLRIIRRDFPPEQRDEVLELLRVCDEGLEAPGTPRLHLAVLKLSAGSVDAVRMHVQAARTDFRDVLSAAEYPEFARVGFVGIDRMSLDEVERLKERDWQQYQEWLSAS
jgi:hypothetical protein